MIAMLEDGSLMEHWHFPHEELFGLTPEYLAQFDEQNNDKTARLADLERWSKQCELSLVESQELRQLHQENKQAQAEALSCKFEQKGANMNTQPDNGKAARLADLIRRSRPCGLNVAEWKELHQLRQENWRAQIEAVRVLKESMEAKP